MIKILESKVILESKAESEATPELPVQNKSCQVVYGLGYL